MEVALLALLVTMVTMVNLLSTFNPRMDYGTILGHCSGLLTFDTSIMYNGISIFCFPMDVPYLQHQ